MATADDRGRPPGDSTDTLLCKILHTLTRLEQAVDEQSMRLSLIERAMDSNQPSVPTSYSAHTTEGKGPGSKIPHKFSASDYEASILRLRRQHELDGDNSSDWSAGIPRVGREMEGEATMADSFVFGWDKEQRPTHLGADEYSPSEYSIHVRDTDNYATRRPVHDDPRAPLGDGSPNGAEGGDSHAGANMRCGGKSLETSAQAASNSSLPTDSLEPSQNHGQDLKRDAQPGGRQHGKDKGRSSSAWLKMQATSGFGVGKLWKHAVHSVGRDYMGWAR